MTDAVKKQALKRWLITLIRQWDRECDSTPGELADRIIELFSRSKP